MLLCFADADACPAKSLYVSDAQGHPYPGSVVGRYANRIKNASFALDGATYHTPANEHGGLNTIQSGPHGYGASTRLPFVVLGRFAGLRRREYRSSELDGEEPFK
jgi:hypothetical protein